MRKARVEYPEAAIRAVHVQPETLLTAELGEITERVDGTGLHAPGVCRDQEGHVAGPAVGRDRRPQVRHDHAEVLPDHYFAGGAEPEREGCLLQARMALCRHVHGEAGMPVEALFPNVPAIDPGTPVPCNLETVPVRV